MFSLNLNKVSRCGLRLHNIWLQHRKEYLRKKKYFYIQQGSNYTDRSRNHPSEAPTTPYTRYNFQSHTNKTNVSFIFFFTLHVGVICVVVLMSMTSLQDFPQNQHRREAQEFVIFFSFDLIRVKTGRVYITSIQISIIVTFAW